MIYPFIAIAVLLVILAVLLRYVFLTWRSMRRTAKTRQKQRGQ